jgi:hypothetical protein
VGTLTPRLFSKQVQSTTLPAYHTLASGWGDSNSRLHPSEGRTLTKLSYIQLSSEVVNYFFRLLPYLFTIDRISPSLNILS